MENSKFPTQPLQICWNTFNSHLGNKSQGQEAHLQTAAPTKSKWAKKKSAPKDKVKQLKNSTMQEVDMDTLHCRINRSTWVDKLSGQTFEIFFWMKTTILLKSIFPWKVQHHFLLNNILSYNNSPVDDRERMIDVLQPKIVLTPLTEFTGLTAFEQSTDFVCVRTVHRFLSEFVQTTIIAFHIAQIWISVRIDSHTSTTFAESRDSCFQCYILGQHWRKKSNLIPNPKVFYENHLFKVMLPV